MATESVDVYRILETYISEFNKGKQGCADRAITALHTYYTRECARKVLEIIGEDEKSKHVRRFQCPNYSNGCYEWAEQWKMNSTPPYCSTDGRKMVSVEFDEPAGDDWARNQLRAELRAAIQEMEGK